MQNPYTHPPLVPKRVITGATMCDDVDLTLPFLRNVPMTVATISPSARPSVVCLSPQC